MPQAAQADAAPSAETVIILADLIARAVTDPIRIRTVEAREGEQDRALTVHPIAASIPAADPDDLARMWADISANGVQVPVTLFEGKVLDGRHRLAIASLTGKTLPCVTFRGDAAAARVFTWSANIARRHLTMPQLGTVALLHFEAAARAAAATRPGTQATGPAGHQPEPWHKEVSRLAGGTVSPATVRRLADSRVTQAPETMTRIGAGQIRRVQQAVTSAAAELGVPPAPPVPRTAFDRLGCARGDIRAARATLRASGPGATSKQQISDRITELRDALTAIEQDLTLG